MSMLRIAQFLLLLIVSSYGVAYSQVIYSAAPDSHAVLRGTLLKSNGRPLPNLELEMVPTNAEKVIPDSRLIGVSDARGHFVFTKVPIGKYTLSVHFNRAPSQISPYGMFFFPGATKRYDAEIFDIDDSTARSNIIFRLPPPLQYKRITGSVMWNGKPVIGAMIGQRDLEFDIVISWGSTMTDSKGQFSVDGFIGRRYQFGAIVVTRRAGDSGLGEILAGAETPVFKLAADSPSLTLDLRTPKQLPNLLDRYMGWSPTPGLTFLSSN